MERGKDVDWDDAKSQKLERERGLSLEEAAEVFAHPYVDRVKNDDPQQGLATGFARGRLVSLAYELREHEGLTLYWLITYWPATKSERKTYEQEIQGQP